MLIRGGLGRVVRMLLTRRGRCEAMTSAGKHYGTSLEQGQGLLTVALGLTVL